MHAYGAAPVLGRWQPAGSERVLTGLQWPSSTRQLSHPAFPSQLWRRSAWELCAELHQVGSQLWANRAQNSPLSSRLHTNFYGWHSPQSTCTTSSLRKRSATRQLPQQPCDTSLCCVLQCLFLHSSCRRCTSACCALPRPFSNTRR